MDKKKLLKILVLLIFIDIALSFVYIMRELEIDVKILNPNLEIYLNKDNYFLSSENSVVVEEALLDEDYKLDVELEGTNLLVLPLFHVKNTPLNLKFNVTLLISINETNASNILEIYFGRAYFNNCYNYTYLGKIETLDGEKVLCGFYKLTDQDPNSEFFNLVTYEVNKYNLDKVNLIIFRFNPFIKGDWQISLKTVLEENFS